MCKGQIPLEWIYNSITQGLKYQTNYWAYCFIKAKFHCIEKWSYQLDLEKTIKDYCSNVI